MAQCFQSRRHRESVEPHGRGRRVFGAWSTPHARQVCVRRGPSRAPAVYIEATSEIQEIKVFGEWAYLWTKLSVVATPKKGGAPIKRAGNTLSILKKQAGAWVIFRDANMLAVVLQ